MSSYFDSSKSPVRPGNSLTGGDGANHYRMASNALVIAEGILQQTSIPNNNQTSKGMRRALSQLVRENLETAQVAISKLSDKAQEGHFLQQIININLKLAKYEQSLFDIEEKPNSSLEQPAQNPVALPLESASPANLASSNLCNRLGSMNLDSESDSVSSYSANLRPFSVNNQGIAALNRFPQSGKSESFKNQCVYCNRPGHQIRTCFQLGRRIVAPVQITNLKTYYQTRHCTNCYQKGHIARSCPMSSHHFEMNSQN